MLILAGKRGESNDLDGIYEPIGNLETYLEGIQCRYSIIYANLVALILKSMRNTPQSTDKSNLQSQNSHRE